MRVQIVSDERGRIVSISKPGDVEGKPSGIRAAGVFPEAGQFVHHVELPKELERESLLDLHTNFRVEAKGETIRLVKSSEFLEPYLRSAKKE